MMEVAPVLPGETLAGKYRVERVLGEGGMGIVVRARHIDLDERVAIKFLLRQPAEEMVERFLREARAAAKVKSEHVCRVFDFGRLDTGEPYIVMEHLEGIDLGRKLRAEGRQRIEDVVGWIVQVCDAMAEAHALGIVHRDLKPANVFLATRPDGAVSAKLLDFGISKLPSHEITRTAEQLGSPAYMSPEQIESSRDVDARSDVWSLGAMLYELLSGRPPFTADSLLQLSVQIREREPAPIEGIPEDLSRAVMKCLAKRRSARWSSVADLVVALSPFAPLTVLGIVARLERSASSFALRQTAASAGPDPAITQGQPAPFAKTVAPGKASSRLAPAETPPPLDEALAPSEERDEAPVLVDLHASRASSHRTAIFERRWPIVAASLGVGAVLAVLSNLGLSASAPMTAHADAVAVSTPPDGASHSLPASTLGEAPPIAMAPPGPSASSAGPLASTAPRSAATSRSRISGPSASEPAAGRPAHELAEPEPSNEKENEMRPAAAPANRTPSAPVTAPWPARRALDREDP